MICEEQYEYLRLNTLVNSQLQALQKLKESYVHLLPTHQREAVQRLIQEPTAISLKVA
jgi:hypothetical protein